MTSLTTSSEAVWATAHHEVVTLPAADKASYLLDTIGPRLAAVGLGLADARQLKAWARGDAEPRGEAVPERLDTLYRVVRVVVDSYSSAVAARLLRSANPELDDEAPLSVLARDDPEGPGRVLRAVRAFLEN